MITKILCTVFIPFLGTVIGSAFVYFMRGKMGLKLQNLLSGFAAGVMVAASVWSLIIPAMGARDKALATVDDIPDPENSRLKMWISIHLGDFDGRMKWGRDYYNVTAFDFLWAFTNVIQSHACQGKPEREKTLKMFGKLEEVANALHGAVGYITYHNVLLYTYQNTVKEYLRDGDFDSAITYFEKLIDTCESFYKHLRDEIQPHELEKLFWDDLDFLMVY